jgi:hypothetical protein
MGQAHVPVGSTTEYAFCPPTSGEHYNVQGQGPIRRDFYPPETVVRPGAWVHNLEHGYIVVAYRGGEDGPTEGELAAMREFFETAPASTFQPTCEIPNKVVVVRFDDMTSDFALLGWNVAMLMDEFDPDRALTFYQQWVDSPQSPERGAC